MVVTFQSFNSRLLLIFRVLITVLMMLIMTVVGMTLNALNVQMINVVRVTRHYFCEEYSY
jgi:hypothetical protein